MADRRVVVLHEKDYSQNLEGLLFPLYCNRRALQKQGVAVDFTVSQPEAVRVGGYALCVSSRFFRRSWAGRQQEIFDFLSQARTSFERIIWFDISDSTGTTQFSVLPFVDRYAKNQVLKDRRLYRQPWYGHRIFSDFYHRRFGVSDTQPQAAHFDAVPGERDLSRIVIGWNDGLAHYGYAGKWLARIWHRVPWAGRVCPGQWHSPARNRPIALSCRIGDVYQRTTIAFSRKRIKQLLRDRNVPVDRLTRRAYFCEMEHSVAGISPFGFGEVCYRDFELVLSGAAMVKQDMDHLETWPNLWIKGKTYLDFKWDLSDLEEKIEFVFRSPEAVRDIAVQAQQMYRDALCSPAGREEFCRRFIALIA
jgi:hypothetical protein